MEYKSENRICQNCKKDFVIEPEDFSFYEKIKVPPPTFCPECRMIRRMAFRDYRVLYKRKSDKTGEIIFSVIHPKSPFKVWERDIWWSDEFDGFNYGRDYDFNKPFFEQLKELFVNTPLPSQNGWNLINSEYCTGANDLKNCYLVYVATSIEDSMYCTEVNKIKNSIDLVRADSSELCYQCFAINKCYNTFFSSNCENSMDIWFSKNLVGCNSCFGCTNLRNKQYYIFNKKYSKEEYFKNFKKFNIGSYKFICELKEKIKKLEEKSIKKFYEGRYNTNVSGDYINNCKNALQSYYLMEVEDGKYLQCFITPSTKNCYDCTMWGGNISLCYECSSVGSDCYNMRFTCRCSKNSKDNEYSYFCYGCSDIFACSGLRNKQYCIFNKQYSKEKYFKLREQIINHMNEMPYINSKGIIYKYGEFLPTELSPYCYNESLAYDYFPLTKEQTLAEGFNWKEKEERNYNIDIKNVEIPDNIKDVNKEILGKIIECGHKGNCNEQCTEAFKITEQEFVFYKKMNLPLPRLCHNCRYYELIKNRNPIKLYHRKCMNEGCSNEFETSYAPDRLEIVYCEKCYQQEIY